ncbi:transposase [Actinomadura yumaensis]|uniref:Transposase n=1 Tax=Actinomadura yumaensis TaxID=111807 RepID=A0ABW2CEL8_9ACTN|nr:transposase [Actinomadura sp. J1-007]
MTNHDADGLQGGPEVRLAAELIGEARAEGVCWSDGLPAGITKTGLQAETAEHLGHERHERPAAPSGDHRNGISAKTVSTKVGPVRIEVPRDRAGEFTPQRAQVRPPHRGVRRGDRVCMPRA